MMISPDTNSDGFLAQRPRADRYGYVSMDSGDVAMKMLSLIKPGSRILDVGCGTGLLSSIIRDKKGATVIGIEPDAARVAIARQNGVEVVQGYLSTDFISQHGLFDYCIFADVLEHVPNPAELVTIAKGCLKGGGSIIASIPNVAHWSVRFNLLIGEFNYTPTGIMDATHLRWFTRDVVRVFFKRFGFTVTALDGTVNINLPCYNKLPWRLIPKRLRRRVVTVLTRLSPGLFGAQHIICATLPK